MTESSTQTPEWGALTSSEAQSNEKWWPNQLNLRILHQNHPASQPPGGPTSTTARPWPTSTSTPSPATSTP